jgi:hypothetical protein
MARRSRDFAGGGGGGVGLYAPAVTSVGLERSDVEALFAFGGFPDVEEDRVILLEPKIAVFLDARLVEKKVFVLVGGDEPVPFFLIVPLDTTFRHLTTPFILPGAATQEATLEEGPGIIVYGLAQK